VVSVLEPDYGSDRGCNGRYPRAHEAGAEYRDLRDVSGLRRITVDTTFLLQRRRRKEQEDQLLRFLRRRKLAEHSRFLAQPRLHSL
jgi:hypothetical protein